MTEVALRREVEELRRDNEMMRAQLDAIRTKLAPIKQQHKAQIDALTTRITALNLEVERLRGEAASSGGGGGGGGGAEQTAELTRLRDEVARLRAYKKRQDEKRATKGEHKTFFPLGLDSHIACAPLKLLPPLPPPSLSAVLLSS